MNIAQITDLHLSRGLTSDIDVSANFQKILDDVAGQAIDLVVLTGDLVQEAGDEQSYVALRQRLDAAGIPFRVAPGNHDDRALVSRIFGPPLRESGEIFSHERFGDVDLFFLDSSQAEFSEGQWAWLDHNVRRAKVTPYLFMHHPPVPAGVTLMDRDWGFRQAGEFRARLLSRYQTITVFCGHYHAEKLVQTKYLDMFLCPAVIFQFDPTDDELRVGSLRCGWRKIELEEGRLATGVRWIDP